MSARDATAVRVAADRIAAVGVAADPADPSTPGRLVAAATAG